MVLPASLDHHLSIVPVPAHLLSVEKLGQPATELGCTPPANDVIPAVYWFTDDVIWEVDAACRYSG